MTGGPEKYRAAQKAAKEAKKRVWKNHVTTEFTMNPKDRYFKGKVVNGDALQIKTGKVVTEVHLASIRPLRIENEDPSQRNRQKRFRPLYDIPFIFEVRYFYYR